MVSHEKRRIAVQHKDMIRTDQIYKRNPYLKIFFPGDVDSWNGTREKYTQYHVGEIN